MTKALPCINTQQVAAKTNSKGQHALMLIIKKLPTSKQYLFGPLLIIVLALSVFFFENTNTDLSYHRDLLEQGQWWLLFSGHILHTNDMHLALNGAAVLLLWALHGQFFSYVNYLIIWLLLALGTSIGLYYFSPEMISYVGLSGVLHGFFVIGACEDIKHKEKTGYLLLFAVIAKVIHEQIFGASKEVMQLIDANVAIDAHLYGLISGLFIVIIISSYAYFTKIKA